MTYSTMANHPALFFLCAIPVIVVVLQSVLFLKIAWNHGQELELEKSAMQKVMINSAVFSILPSLPIIVMLLALSVPLGRYFPWLRLSIVGSAAYEGMAANIAANSMGLENINSPAMTPATLIVIMLVMTIGIIWGIVFNIFFMNRLDSFSKKARKQGNAFLPIFTAALFCGMLSTISMPYVANIHNPCAIISFLIAGGVVLILNFVSKKFNIKVISEFSLPIALIVGMASAVGYTLLFSQGTAA